MREIVSRQLAASAPSIQTICDACGMSTSSVECRECDRMFCRKCDCKIHQANDLTEHLRQVSDAPESDVCVSHMQPLIAYCTKCRRCICDECMCNTHKKHIVSVLKDIAEEKRVSLSQHKLHLQNICSRTDSIGSYIEQYMGSVGITNGGSVNLSCEGLQQTAKNTVNQTFDNLLAALQKRREEMLAIVDKEFEKKRTQLLCQKDSACKLGQEARNMIGKCEDISCERDAPMVAMFTEMESSLNSLVNTDINSIVGPISDLRVHVTFDADLQKLNEIIRKLGKVGDSAIIESADGTLRGGHSSTPVTNKNSGIPKCEELTYNDLSVGMRVDALDTANRWAEAEIVDMNPVDKTVLLSYVYWSKEWDEWIPVISEVIAPLKTHTLGIGQPMQVGQRVEICDDKSKWREGFVTGIEGHQIEVFYEDDKLEGHTVIIDSRMDRIRQYGIATSPPKPKKHSSEAFTGSTPILKSSGKKRSRAGV